MQRRYNVIRRAHSFIFTLTDKIKKRVTQRGYSVSRKRILSVHIGNIIAEDFRAHQAVAYAALLRAN